MVTLADGSVAVDSALRIGTGWAMAGRDRNGFRLYRDGRALAVRRQPACVARRPNTRQGIDSGVLFHRDPELSGAERTLCGVVGGRRWFCGASVVASVPGYEADGGAGSPAPVWHGGTRPGAPGGDHQTRIALRDIPFGGARY